MTDEAKTKEMDDEILLPPVSGDPVGVAAIKSLFRKLNIAVNGMASKSDLIMKHFKDRPTDDGSTEKFFDDGCNIVADLSNASADVKSWAQQIRKEFPTMLSSESIFSDDPGSVCSDFITPLLKSEMVVGTVIDGVLASATVCIPQIDDMEELREMVDKLRVFIEHDLQETSIPRLVVVIATNVKGAPANIRMFATQITDLVMCTDATKVQVKEMEIQLDQFQLQIVEAMLLDIREGNVVKKEDVVKNKKQDA